MNNIKKILYNGFLKIQSINGIDDKVKHRMLWEMFSLNGKNPLNWEVVGITKMAYDKLKENNWIWPKGNKDNKINRSHIKDRLDTSLKMFSNFNWSEDSWWNFYRERDKCILATGTENMSKKELVIKYYVPKKDLPLFRSKGFNAHYGSEEKTFLKEIVQ